MKHNIKKIAEFVIRRSVTVTALLFAVYVNGLSATPQTPQTPAPLQPPPVTAKEKVTIKAFETRVKSYLKLRDGVKGRLPKLSKDSTPEQIESYRKSFEEQMRASRAGAKDGDLFRAGVATYIRKTLRTEFQGKDRVELRDIVFDEATAGVPVRVNYPYPEQKEIVEMPATLLAKLPQVPKELRYRFVGRKLLLVDRDNNLIIDYMADALP